MSEDWRPRAACRTAPPNAAFVNANTAAAVKFVEEFCAECPVISECLAETMAVEGHLVSAGARHGIFGGLTGVQRAGLAKFGRRACAKCATPFVPTATSHLRCPACRRTHTSKPTSVPVSEHGTRAGYEQHLRRLEQPCDACSSANSWMKRLWKLRKRSAA